MKKHKQPYHFITKEDLIHMKDMGEEDWRGIMALIIIIGGFLIIAFAMIIGKYEITAAVTPLMVLVTQWYFKSKEKGVCKNYDP